jgi:glycosyltransferase involved in cell wall biosynthesis
MECKIKVLEVIQQGEIGGGESHLLTLMGEIDKNRFEPVVVALSDGEMISRLTKMGIRNYVVNTRLPFNIMVWKQLRRILLRERIDIIHTHGARALSNLLQPARRLGIPVIHTIHGWSFHDHLPAWKRRIRIMGERFLTSRATLNIAVSESNRRIGLEKLGVFRCEVVHNGVDLSVFGANVPHGGIRGEFGIQPGAVVITFVARFIHDKNPLPLVRAFGALVHDYPEARLIMVGDGPAREEAMKLAAGMNLNGLIFFPGFRRDVPEILADSDIFCLPSIKEGLPVSLIEAMAVKNAVIATDVQGCVDVVTNGADGLLVPLDGLQEGLEKALRTLLSDPDRRRVLAARARAKVEEQFDAKGMTRKLEDLYEKLRASKKFL